ncbi:YigZ family protein [Weissella viridescens]|uniref:YigZ family protein n=1 Tax=Weissella viridescens TaxID=1629 RepID=A0A3P2RKG2_WEIVI|nr:YigZ family protein [Weissella viridescens]RRG17928.1 YigZ family protein [Weissella viridescens]
MVELDLTIAQQSAMFEQDIKKSRFILHIARVADEDEAQTFITEIKKQERKANHNVWAYVLGKHDEIQRYSDDGEPAGTAGVPMLEVLKNNQLHNVVAVVTRYFGGIKLGAGGLIRAYAGTVAEGIADVGLVELVQQQEVMVTVAYSQFETIKYWLEQQGYQILATDYQTDVVLTVGVPTESIDDFTQAVEDQLAGKVNITVGAERVVERPYSRDISAKTASLK